MTENILEEKEPKRERTITQFEPHIKTTIDIAENLWRDFSVAVIEERGGRKKSEVICELIETYVKKHKR